MFFKMQVCYFPLQHKLHLAQPIRSDHTQNWFTESRVRGFNRKYMVPKSASNKDWLNGRTIEYEIRSLIKVILTPGVVGTWNIEIDETASKTLFKEGQTLSWDAVPREQVYGNFTNFELHHTFKSWGNQAHNSRFKQALTGWSTSTKDIFQRSLANAFAGLGGTIILPAGDCQCVSSVSWVLRINACIAICVVLYRSSQLRGKFTCPPGSACYNRMSCDIATWLQRHVDVCWHGQRRSRQCVRASELCQRGWCAIPEQEVD
jgi:hypothetical protein